MKVPARSALLRAAYVGTGTVVTVDPFVPAEEIIDAIDDLCRAFREGAVDASTLAKERFHQGLAWPQAPLGLGGYGARHEVADAVERRFLDEGCPRWKSGPPLSTEVVGPLIVEFGTQSQRQEWLYPMFVSNQRWCQLFSEYSAGSDLGAIRCTAHRVGERWVLNGAKCWSSWSSEAEFGILLADTIIDDVSIGLTCFLINMSDPGVQVRPIRQMTGTYGFGEVSFSDVYVQDSHVLGRAGGGGNIAVRALLLERKALQQRAGEASRSVLRDIDAAGAELGAVARDSVVKIWIEDRVSTLPAHTRGVVAAMHSLRGQEIYLLGRLRQMNATQAAAGMRVHLAGAQGMLHVGDAGLDVEFYDVSSDPATALLNSRAESIAGGTREVLKNLIAERILGLPR